MNAYIRFGVILLLLGAGVAAARLRGFQDLDRVALLSLGVAMTVYNVLLLVLSARTARARCSTGRVLRFERLLVASVVLDFLSLTVAIWIVGGGRSPFLGFYLFHLAVAAFLLPSRTALRITLLAILLLAGLVLGEYLGVVPVRAPEGAVLSAEAVTGEYAMTVIAVYSALFVLFSATATGLMDRLRFAEHEVDAASLEIERLSAMRRQFLLLAMHNMNAPIAAASMLLRNLHDGMLGPLEPGQEEQLGRALKRLDGLSGFLADLRLFADLQSTDLHEHSTEISMEFLMNQAVDTHRELAERKSQTLVCEPACSTGLVFGVPRLLHEALCNFISNAIKYTPAGGEIRARILSRDGRVRAEISDTGVGIDEGDLSRVFNEFVRLGWPDPQTKKEPGSGLGLALAKRIAESHGGVVGVRSTPGEGSTFWMDLPACGAPGSPGITTPVSP